MSTLAGKARRLELARGIGRDGSRAAPVVSLVWCGVEVAIDPDELDPDQFVVSDYVITEHCAVDPSHAMQRDRVTHDAEDFGRVYALTLEPGREIGRVLRAVGGGRLLEYSWPAELPASASTSL
jgi:hypothetical protein